MDTPEEHSESEDEREEDALVELGDDDGEDGLPTDAEDGLPTDAGRLGSLLMGRMGSLLRRMGSLLGSMGSLLSPWFWSERPCAVGRPIATPQLRSCNPPHVAVPPAPVATESYEHLGSVSSLRDALDAKLHIGENDAPQDS